MGVIGNSNVKKQLFSLDSLSDTLETEQDSQPVEEKKTATPATSKTVQAPKTPLKPAAMTKAKPAPKKSGTYNSKVNVLTKGTNLSREAKNDDFGNWYKNVLLNTKMLDYYDISGCYIMRPYALEMWEFIQQELQRRITAEGVEGTYFPMLVSQKALEKEEQHLEGFKAEVAWVTHKGDSELEEKVAIRPTSETIMYPAFAKWIRSHRDLPLKLNQWSNVVRWEFKDPTPFVRSREFLWQEGHTVHQTPEEAESFSKKMLDHYAEVYEDLLAVPVIKGFKTDEETFPGAKKTYTCELVIDANGKGMQGATSHDLGDNFSKIFDIKYENQEGNLEHGHQTCWGFTTRSIGAAIMVHGDDKGLVLPPKVAKYQVVVVPIYKANEPTDKIDTHIDSLVQKLEKKGVRVHVDRRDNHTAGWKFNDWELKGVPIRIDVGTKDVENDSVTMNIRFNGEKSELGHQKAGTFIPNKLKTVHNQMLNKAKRLMKSKVRTMKNLYTAKKNIKNGNIVQIPVGS